MRPEVFNYTIPDLNSRTLVYGRWREFMLSEIGDAVSEAVYVQYLALYFSVLLRVGPRNGKAAEVVNLGACGIWSKTERQVSGKRRKYVAPVKSRARMRSKQIRAHGVVYAHGRGFFVYITEKPVVRPYEKPPVRFNDDCAARRSYAGIDYGKMNRTLRKVAEAGAEGEGSEGNIVRRYVVRKVDDDRGGVDREYRALERGREVVGRAEIGQEGNHARH